MSRLIALGSVVLLTASVVVVPSRASLYHPQDPSLTLPVQADGKGEALPFEEFKRRFFVITNIANSDQVTKDRSDVETRALAANRKANLTPEETIGLAVDLLHLGAVGKPAAPAGFGAPPAKQGRLSAEDAFNRLIPMARTRPTYDVLATLAHLYAAREDWPNAISHLESALLDYAPPPLVAGLTAEQRAWQARLDREYVLPMFRRYQQEAARKGKPEPETEQPPPLFPLRGEPVRFVNEAGQYEPGSLAAAEKAKLPPDAVAIVQQLLLWFPGDSRLYWLLAELYAAEGKLEAADAILDELSWSRRFGNRRVMMEHRAAVKEAIEAKRKAADEEAAKSLPISWTTIAIYFTIVAAVVGFAAYRSIRRGLRGCGPMGCR